jgi:hypothetical protein
MSSLEKVAREQKAEETFLALLGRYEAAGRNVSEKSSSPTYAPKAFCKERDANGFRKEELLAAMLRLFETQRIHIEQYGRPSRPYSRIREGRKEGHEENNQG